MVRGLVGLLHPSNLLSLLPSSRPRGQLSGPIQRAWPAGPKLPRKAGDRWALRGARPWFPPRIASASVFLETSPYLPGQSMLLVPVPTGTHPPWHLPADMMGEAVGELTGRKQWSLGTGIHTTCPDLPYHSFFLGCINYLVSFIF